MGIKANSARPPEGRAKVAAIFADVAPWIVVALALIALAARLRFGYDLVDESYYVGGAYRFARGVKPFIDDLSAHQSSAYLIHPLVSLWLFLTGGLEGVVLALRIVYFATSVIAAVVSFHLIRRFVDRRLAALAAAFSVGLVPWLIFAPSYNTIAALAVSLAISAVGFAILDEKPGLVVLGGCLLGIAAIAYPTLAVVLPVAAALLAWLERSWRQAGLLLAGGIGVLGLFLAIIAADLFAVRDMLAYNASWPTGAPKLVSLAVGLASSTYLAPAAWLVAIIVMLRIFRKPIPFAIAVALPIAALLAIHVDVACKRTMTVSILVFLSAVVTWRSPTDDRVRKVLTFALALAAAAAAIIAYTSNSSFAGAGVGLSAAAAPAMALLLKNADDAVQRKRKGPPVAAVAIGIACVTLIVATCWEATYASSPPWTQDTKGEGPFAGLLTTAPTAAETAQLESTLGSATRPDDRLLVYGLAPGAYLLSAATPATPNLWLSPLDGQSETATTFLLPWIALDRHWPSVVAVPSDLWQSRDGLPEDHLLQFLEAEYTVVDTDHDCVILRDAEGL